VLLLNLLWLLALISVMVRSQAPGPEDRII
jgi:hypothetical protein